VESPVLPSNQGLLSLIADTTRVETDDAVVAGKGSPMRTSVGVVSFILASSLALTPMIGQSSAIAEPGPSEEWSQYAGSPGRAWWVPTFPGFDLDRKWTSPVTTVDFAASCVLAVADKVVAIRRVPPSTRSSLVVVSQASGEIVWSGAPYTPTDDRCPASFGGLVFNSEGSDLVARSVSDGSVAWAFASGGILSSPSASADGIVYVSVSDPSSGSGGWLVALAGATGVVQWGVPSLGASQNMGFGPPVVGADFVAEVLGLDRSSGNGMCMQMFRRTDGMLLGPPCPMLSDNIAQSAVASGNTLFWTEVSKRTVRSTDAFTGATNWSYIAADDLVPQSLTLAGSTLYVDMRCQQCRLGRVVALDTATGALLWSTDVPADAFGLDQREIFFASPGYVTTQTKVVDRITGAVVGDIPFQTAYGSSWRIPEPAFADGVVYSWVMAVDGTKVLVAQADLFDPPLAPAWVGAEVGQVFPGSPNAWVTVRWGAPAADPRRPVVSYTVRQVGSNAECRWTGGPLECRFYVPTNTTVQFSVAAVNAKGEGPSAFSAPLAVPLTPVPPASGPVIPPVVVPTAPVVSVAVKSVDRGNKLYVNVNPNKGSGYWTFSVQKRTSAGTWKTLTTTYKTYGKGETRTLDLKKGTYRVIVKAKYGYQGSTSAEVYLKK
jgi:outer membrane protein assembly factor BamB